MKKCIPVSIILLVLLMLGCQKDEPKKNKPSNVFKPDTTTIEINDSLFINYQFTPESMVYDTTDNSLYFYLSYNSNGSGFEILKYNLTSGSLISVYVNADPNWANSNGSEAQRMYLYNKSLWIPGGATNGYLFKLTVGNNSLTMDKSYNTGNTDFGGKNGNNPYAITSAAGKIYTASMSNLVFYGTYGNTITDKGYFETSPTSHGTSIVTVTVDSVQHLMVKCGSSNKIELRKTDGTFIRSVATPANNSSAMVADSKGRVYFYDYQTMAMTRYSADLLTKETYHVYSFSSYKGFALREDGNHVTLFSLMYKGIGMVRLPW